MEICSIYKGNATRALSKCHYSPTYLTPTYAHTPTPHALAAKFLGTNRESNKNNKIKKEGK